MDAIREWFFSLGGQYGVNPLVFGAIYVGAIPFFMLSIAWLIRNARAKKSVARGGGGADSDFDVAVIGGGAAGLTAAGIAASFGAKTLLVEGARLGGDCTWTGCIPSKTLLKAAKVAHERRHASHYGLTDVDLPIDSRALMEHVRKVRQEVYAHADAPALFEAMGIDVRAGRATFVDSHTIAITGANGAEERVRARFIILATGGRPQIPEIAGLDDVPYLTSESVFELEEIPKRILVVGGGPIGCELSQAMRRLGADVTLVQRGDAILPKDDPELTGMLVRTLETEGVKFFFGAETKRVARVANDRDAIRVTLDVHGGERVVVVDAILIATGRSPNVESLDVAKAGVKLEKKGIVVDDRCRTNVHHIYACGDVTGRYLLTHVSEHMAKVAATNVMLKLPTKIDTRHVPWCTFTDPELAHVGATEAELTKAKTTFDVYRFPYDKIDRAITDGETSGMIKVYAKRATGKILGASILGASAGDLIGELAVAMRNGVTLRKLADTIHPYPTLGLGVRRAADQWYVRKRSRRFVRVLQMLFGYRGALRDFDPNEIV